MTGPAFSRSTRIQPVQKCWIAQRARAEDRLGSFLNQLGRQQRSVRPSEGRRRQHKSRPVGEVQKPKPLSTRNGSTPLYVISIYISSGATNTILDG